MRRGRSKPTHPFRHLSSDTQADLGYGHDGYEHTVNSHINRLRSKIERDHAPGTTFTFELT